jgi:3D (Asp-Asp-Asp) domain-containing protein
MLTNIIYATITAYCACTTCCGPDARGITASGKRPLQGLTIAAPRAVPFGTKVFIAQDVLRSRGLATPTGWNGFVVQDRLSKRYDSRFDVYFTRHADARKFGIKTNQQVIVVLPSL